MTTTPTPPAPTLPLYYCPIAVCATADQCCVCLAPIAVGQRCYDGGTLRRAHIDCGNLARMGRRR